jgi:hypothetical protein
VGIPPPTLGQHYYEVLGDVGGLDDDTIPGPEADGVIVQRLASVPIEDLVE